jgi:hypothetical protein
MACREHEFGGSVSVGGGLARKSCERCGTVHLEPTRDEVLINSGLFQSGRIRWMSWEPSAQPQIRYEHTFGKAPAGRRRLASAVA